jgi:hypothetical protein
VVANNAELAKMRGHYDESQPPEICAPCGRRLRQVRCGAVTVEELRSHFAEAVSERVNRAPRRTSSGRQAIFDVCYHNCGISISIIQATSLYLFRDSEVSRALAIIPRTTGSRRSPLQTHDRVRLIQRRPQNTMIVCHDCKSAPLLASLWQCR